MSGGQCRTGEPLIICRRPNTRKTDPERNLQTHSGVGDEQSRNYVKTARYWFRFHASMLLAFGYFAKNRTDTKSGFSERSPDSCFLPIAATRRMKQSMVLIVAALVAASPVCARLGDTSDKIEDSYGTILQRRLRDDGTVSVVYHRDGYLYLVTFGNDRSISESYSHLKGNELSEREIKRFLKANSAGGTWMPDNIGNHRHFTRSDGNAEAIYAPVNGRPALTVREIHSDHRHRDQ